MSNQYNLIILGGGCAGLSLAARLSAYGESAPKTLVLDKRPAYTNDRTWCFWRLPGSAAEALVERSWSRFEVRSGPRTVTADCSTSPYSAISASGFYAHSLTLIHSSSRVNLHTGVTVLGDVRASGSRWEVRTDQGCFLADSIVDTRPRREPATGDALLWQTFFGAEVVFSSPCLDTSAVTLMDFRLSPPGRIVFTYVLPFSAEHGLVEVTEFSPLAMPPAALQPLLTSVLREMSHGKAFATLRTEAGALPMGLPPDPLAHHAPRVVPRSYVRAGVLAGGARAATGYAFQRIQRWADRCAASLHERALPMGHPADPPLLALLDYLFLRVLRQYPDRAPDLFAQLFAFAPTPAVLRFLGDQATAADVLQVIHALPPGVFVKELFTLWGERAAEWRESLAA